VSPRKPRISDRWFSTIFRLSLTIANGLAAAAAVHLVLLGFKHAVGESNLALKAGAFSIVTSYAGGSVANMPSGTAGEVLRKAAVTGAVAGSARLSPGDQGISNAARRKDSD